MNYYNIGELSNKIKEYPLLDSLLQSRNLSELVKLIPYLGSLIESNTLGRLKDEKLNFRLLQLDEALSEVLTINDGNQLLTLIENNRLLLYNFVGHFQNELLSQNEKLRIQIKETLAIKEYGDKLYLPNDKFHFVVISGASATGKDTVLNKVKRHYYKGFPKNEVLIKYTTRRKRKSDSLYYKFLSTKQYNKSFHEDEIIFPFKKREHKYGFSKEQLIDSLGDDKILFCIYTDFDSLIRAKASLSALQIQTTFILLEAKFKELKDRSWGRNFTTLEITSRIDSIKKDHRFIKDNPEIINEIFDYRIYSGDNKSKNELIREIIACIESNIQSTS